MNRKTSTALIAIDDLIYNLPFVVRRDHRMVAAFAKKAHALDWAEMRSFNDEAALRCILPTKSSTLFKMVSRKMRTTMTSNRRLVPMPSAKKPRPPSPTNTEFIRYSPTPVAALIFPKRRATPPIGWPLQRHDWMALIVTVCIIAVAWPLRHVIFLIAAIYFLLRIWLYICRHHPLLGWFLLGFLRGLLGRRR